MHTPLFAAIDHVIGCVTCDPALWASILEHRFWLLVLTIAPGVLLGGFAVAWATGVWARRIGTSMKSRGDAAALPWAATVLGLGLGGFVDGIVLHQILQVHAMISNILPPDTVLAKGTNMFWDGVFHIATWTFTMVGVIALWRIARRHDVVMSGALFWGGLLHGWGSFTILDSIMNHYVFRYHNVVEASAAPWVWNLGFLVLGLLLVVGGMAAMRHSLRAANGTNS